MDEIERLRDSIADLPLSMVLTDPALDDNPLVYVNASFERVTGYSSSAVIGRNCRLLQGKDTDPESVAKIRKGLEQRREVSVDIANEKADGTGFTNRLFISPIDNADGDVLAFLGVQFEVEDEDKRVPDDTMLRELQHRVKNHLAMVVGMIRMQSRQEISADSFKALSHRIESLALLYEELTPGGISHAGAKEVPAGAYMSRIANTLGALDGRASVRVNVECEEISLPVETAARLGLILTEFLTNALEHAFEGLDEGVVRVRFQRLSGTGVRLMVEDDGVGIPEDSNWPHESATIEKQTDTVSEDGDRGDGITRTRGMGGSIVASLVDSLGGVLNVNSATRGTVITLDFDT